MCAHFACEHFNLEHTRTLVARFGAEQAYPDMLEVGNLASFEEDRAHFGAW